MYSKKVAGFKGIVAFPYLTFRSDDDDLKASDVIMSRICAADDSGVTVQLSKLRRINDLPPA